MTIATVTPVNSDELEELYGRDKMCSGSRRRPHTGETIWTCPNVAEFHIQYDCDCDCGTAQAFVCATCLSELMNGRGKCGMAGHPITEWKMQ
jgi:hypothetical protein